MFVLADEIVVKRKVIVKVPVDGTAFKDVPLTLHYKILKNSEVEQKRPDELLKSVIVGWEPGGIVDDKGQPVGFSEEALSKLLDFPFVIDPAMQGYLSAAMGSRQKN